MTQPTREELAYEAAYHSEYVGEPEEAYERGHMDGQRVGEERGFARAMEMLKSFSGKSTGKQIEARAWAEWLEKHK